MAYGVVVKVCTLNVQYQGWTVRVCPANTQELARNLQICFEFDFELICGCCAFGNLLLLPSFYHLHIQLLVATHSFYSLGLVEFTACPAIAKLGLAAL